VLRYDGSASGELVGTYTHNALGQRTAKVVTFPAASSQRFTYDEASQLVGEYGNTTRDYIWLGDLPIAVVDTAGGVSTVSYVHADGLGTPRAVTDATGASIWQLAHQGNAFGEQQPSSASGYTYNLRFPGQYYDVETGLNYNGARYYEAATGRYIQSDPIGLNGGPNTYAYVGGKPLSRVDQLGLQEEPVENIEEEREEFDNLFGRKLGPNQVSQNIVEEQIAEGTCRAPGSKGPPIYINPANISGLRPGEIDALARSMGLIPRGPDPMNGRGSYLDPDTGQQRILSHPDADPPHAHVNDPSGQRLDINGNSVPAESPEAHLPIGR
jgi:RHS repeat-associated protein